MSPARRLLVVAGLAGCARGPAVTACDDDLGGAYDDGEATWVVLDHGAEVEAYPVTPDAPRDPARPGLVAAPRTLALRREGAALAGEARRRYMEGAARCEARGPARVRACAGDALLVELPPLPPPTGFAPCAWPAAAPASRARWRRR